MIGLIFDIDDTLYSRQDLLVRAAKTVMKDQEFDTAAFLDIFYRKADENVSLFEKGTITPLESNIWRYTETFKELGLKNCEEGGALAAPLYTDLQNRITLSDPLANMFDALADAGLVLGALTTGATAHQWNKYRMLGLERWIRKDLTVVSGEVGCTKPDPAIFRIVEERTSLTPDDLWMIGDSLKSDISGADAAGWHSIWINRMNQSSGNLTPDITVYTEEEMIAQILQKFTP